MNKKEKIIILSDGIGNQLFQYLFALKLKRLGYLVALDGYKLERSKILFNAFNSELKYRRNLVGYYANRIYLFVKFKFCFNVALNFKKNVFQQEDPFELDVSVNSKFFEGYFQNIHLLGVKENLHIEFNDKFNLSSDLNINFNRSCAIHFRAGDYAGVHFHILGSDYYHRAIARMISEKNVNTFYVFSTDDSYTKRILDEFQNINFIFVSSFNMNDFNELKLMSRFKNIIIANSTFSIWAAYLGCKNKFVIAPSNWISIDVNPRKTLYLDHWFIC